MSPSEETTEEQQLGIVSIFNFVSEASDDYAALRKRANRHGVVLLSSTHSRMIPVELN